MSEGAIDGESGAYVPCDDLASPFPADPVGAITGSDVGYVSRFAQPAAFPADPVGAIGGSGVGFVSSPCTLQGAVLYLAESAQTVLEEVPIRFPGSGDDPPSWDILLPDDTELIYAYAASGSGPLIDKITGTDPGGTPGISVEDDYVAGAVILDIKYYGWRFLGHGDALFSGNFRPLRNIYETYGYAAWTLRVKKNDVTVHTITGDSTFPFLAIVPNLVIPVLNGDEITLTFQVTDNASGGHWWINAEDFFVLPSALVA